jgi:hypothetical protein
LYPSDYCEQTFVSDEIGNGYISMAWYKGILAIIIANPI